MVIILIVLGYTVGLIGFGCLIGRHLAKWEHGWDQRVVTYMDHHRRHTPEPHRVCLVKRPFDQDVVDA